MIAFVFGFAAIVFLSAYAVSWLVASAIYWMARALVVLAEILV